jgi:4-amino-4-deoxy-L-arabinose transferase-like glycosyltransferase
MNKRKSLALVLFFTLLGGFLRFWQFTKIPVSLSIDEVSFGYSAYSILKTGRDEYGVFLPLTFESTGDYKNPVPIYLMVPSIAVFGLNEFGVRFPYVLAGTLTIPVFYLFIRKLTANNYFALIAMALLAVSSWHIYYSRFASDHMLALFWVISGTYFFLLALEKNNYKYPFAAAFFYAASMYTYYSARFFTPVFVFFLLLISFKKLLRKRKVLLVFLATAIILGLPIVARTFFGPDASRARMVFLSKDIDFTRNVLLESQPPVIEKSLLLFFFWVRRYINYLQPVFLFFNGLFLTRPDVYGLGVLYLFEIITFCLGFIYLIRSKIKNKNIIVLWFFLGFLPASIANNEHNAGRALIALPVLILISAFGVWVFYQYLRSLQQVWVRNFLAFAAFTLVSWSLLHAFFVYSAYYPVFRGEDFMEGTKEAVVFALAEKDKYDEIVFDPYRGVVGPYIVNIPHMYLLFYSKYDPHQYQTEPKVSGDEFYHFDKFTIRKIDWQTDRNQKNTLFVGSPWSLPEKDIAENQILQKVYLTSGDLVYLVVSAKP